MKNIIFKLFILTVIVGIGFSCNKKYDPYGSVVPDFGSTNGAIVLYDVIRNSLSKANITTSSYSADLSARGNVKTLEVRIYVRRIVVEPGPVNVTFTSDTVSLKNVETFPSTFTMNGSEIVTAAKRLNRRNAAGQSLYNPANPTTFITLSTANDLLRNDRIFIVCSIVTQDGKRYEIKDINGELLTTPSLRCFMQLFTDIGA